MYQFYEDKWKWHAEFVTENLKEETNILEKKKKNRESGKISDCKRSGQESMER